MIDLVTLCFLSPNLPLFSTPSHSFSSAIHIFPAVVQVTLCCGGGGFLSCGELGQQTGSSSHPSPPPTHRSSTVLMLFLAFSLTHPSIHQHTHHPFVFQIPFLQFQFLLLLESSCSAQISLTQLLLLHIIFLGEAVLSPQSFGQCGENQNPNPNPNPNHPHPHS